MATYNVDFIQHWFYTVEAKDEDEAFDLAHKEFISDMRSSVACTIYDDCQIECIEEDEDEYGNNV